MRMLILIPVAFAIAFVYTSFIRRLETKDDDGLGYYKRRSISGKDRL